MRAVALLLTFGILAPNASVARAIAPPQPRQSIVAAAVAVAPRIDGVVEASEWSGVMTPMTFHLPRGRASGTLRVLHDAAHLFLAIALDERAGAMSVLTVAIDPNGDGVLRSRDPAYQSTSDGRSVLLEYDASRRAFVRRPSGAPVTHALHWKDGRRTDELRIPLPIGVGRIGLAIELTVGGARDTWPTTARRDRLARVPQQWALVTLEHIPVTAAVRAGDRTPPRIDLTVQSDRPSASESVGVRGTAFDASGIDRIELWIDGVKLRTCTATSVCETSTGPHAIGTIVRIDAYAVDRHGNRATASRTITVQPPERACEDLGIPTSFIGSGTASDPASSAAAVRDGALHLGSGPIGEVWGELYAFHPSLTDALALAWTGIRHGVNPNLLTALALKESRYACTRYADGCFQVAAPAFRELEIQFPRAFRGLTYGPTVQNAALAPQVAAYHFRLSGALFTTWYAWEAFHRTARDPFARTKLLLRAYNVGAWDRNITAMLTRDRDRCGATDDLLTCYDAQEMPRDHSASIVGTLERLATASRVDQPLAWEDVRMFLEAGVRPMTTTEHWTETLTDVRARYECLHRNAGGFTFARELPRLLMWLAHALPPIEDPQAIGDYRAPNL